MELQINEAISRRQSKQLHRTIIARLKHYQQGISAERAANEDRKFNALLVTLLKKAISSDVTDIDLTSTSGLYIELAYCLITPDVHRLSSLLSRLADQWQELDTEIYNVVADVLIRLQSPLLHLLKQDEQCLQALISAADKAWLQYLSVFLQVNVRQRIIPEDSDWLGNLQCSDQSLSFEQALAFIGDNAGFIELPEVNSAWVLIFCDQSDPEVQHHLQSLEQIEPDTVYSVYGVWGEPWCLARIAEGLLSSRTNAAAYKQWLFLTKFPLPQIPILEEAGLDGAKPERADLNIPVLADAKAAQKYLVELNEAPLNESYHRTAQQIRLANALLTQHAQHQEIYALGLMTLNKQITHISIRQSYGEHLNNLATLVALSKTPWWSIHDAN